jgi:hypothetical protein
MKFIRDTYNCGKWTDPDGTEYTISEMSFPDLEDDTIAFDFTGSDGTFSLEGNVVFIRKGDVVCYVAVAGLNSVDSSVTEELARKAAKKL